MGADAVARAPRGGWSAIGAGFTVLFICTGVNFSFGILFKSILQEFGGGRATLALAAMANLGVYGLSQLFFGTIVDRVGARRVILPSMALMALGTALVGLAQTPWQLVFLYGIVTSVGYTGTSILPISVHIQRWFPRQRGFVIAMAASGFSLGHLVFTQLAAYTGAAVGWRGTYWLMAGVLVLFLVVVAAWLRDPPQVPRVHGAAESSPELDRSLTQRAALATPAFWWMTGGYIWCGFTDFLLTIHLPPFATDLGLGQSAAANAVSIWSVANIVGILVAGSVANRFGVRRALVATYLVRVVSLFLLLAVRDTWQLYLFAILFGATFFTTAPLSSTLVRDLFGPASQGAIFGIANMFHHMGGALGAYTGGLVFDLTGSYLGIFVASGILVLASAGLTSMVRSPGLRPVERA